MGDLQRLFGSGFDFFSEDIQAFDARPRCRNTHVLGSSGAEIPLVCRSPGQKCRTFGPPGGRLCGTFRPCGEVYAAYAGIAERAQFLVPSRARRSRVLVLVPNAPVLAAKTAAQMPVRSLDCPQERWMDAQRSSFHGKTNVASEPKLRVVRRVSEEYASILPSASISVILSTE
jgi:hypothetical protein